MIYRRLKYQDFIERVRKNMNELTNNKQVYVHYDNISKVIIKCDDYKLEIENKNKIDLIDALDSLKSDIVYSSVLDLDTKTGSEVVKLIDEIISKVKKQYEVEQRAKIEAMTPITADITLKYVLTIQLPLFVKNEIVAGYRGSLKSIDLGAARRENELKPIVIEGSKDEIKKRIGDIKSELLRSLTVPGQSRIDEFRFTNLTILEKYGIDRLTFDEANALLLELTKAEYRLR